VDTNTGRIVLPAVTTEANDFLSTFRQGEIIDIDSLGIHTLDREENQAHAVGFRARLWNLGRWLGLNGRTTDDTASREDLSRIPTPLGAVVLSQTCDIVQSDRLTVQLAPVVRLEGERANQAGSGRRPQYVAIPNANDGLFADLERICTMHKNDIVGMMHRPGVNTPLEGRKLAQAIGRRFTRFPFPDNLHPWLRPLEEVLQKKASKTASPEGRVLEHVIEIRIEAEGKWETPEPYNLTVIVVVEQGTLPYGLGDQVPEQSSTLSTWLRTDGGDLRRPAADIASRIEGTTTSPADKYYLWLALAEAWAEKCKPHAGASAEELAAVSSLEGEVVSADELTMDRWWGSEALDLDHLSPPRPL